MPHQGLRQFSNRQLEEAWRKKNKLETSQVGQDVWKTLGNYVGKAMRSGKGVIVPKLGTFTFTQTTVDLAGTTNQLERDKQVRVPVFQIVKDFAPGLHISQGISTQKG